MLQIADTDKTREQILRADVDDHLRHLQHGLCTLRLLVRAMSHGVVAWNCNALLFSIDAMDEPIDAIGDLMEADEEGSRLTATAVAAAPAPAANEASPPPSPELVALVHKLNVGISRSNLNKPNGRRYRCRRRGACGRAKRHRRSDRRRAIHVEREILEFPIRSVGDLVILAKLAEHQHYYGQMSDDTPVTLADGILKMFAFRRAHRRMRRSTDRPLTSKRRARYGKSQKASQ